MTEQLRGRMVAYAAKILRRRLQADDAAQLAEDVVHDALVYHLARETWDEGRFVGAVAFYAKVAGRPLVLDVAMPAGAKRASMTHTFPVQVFGCMLADAFAAAPGDA